MRSHAGSIQITKVSLYHMLFFVSIDAENDGQQKNGIKGYKCRGNRYRDRDRIRSRCRSRFRFENLAFVLPVKRDFHLRALKMAIFDLVYTSHTVSICHVLEFRLNFDMYIPCVFTFSPIKRITTTRSSWPETVTSFTIAQQPH